MFIRRIGPQNDAAHTACRDTYGCPDIWELAGGDFAVIGADMTEHAGMLPPSAGCAPTERVVRIPRQLLVQAKPHIPDTV